MSDSTRQIVKKYFEKCFPEATIKETDEGFKFNVKSLSREEVETIVFAPCSSDTDILVKRSGAGLLVVIG